MWMICEKWRSAITISSIQVLTSEEEKDRVVANVKRRQKPNWFYLYELDENGKVNGEGKRIK